MTCLYAYGCSFPAGSEIDTPEKIGITREEWFDFYFDNWDQDTEFSLLQKFVQKSKNNDHLLYDRYYKIICTPSEKSYPNLLAKNLGYQCVNRCLMSTSAENACRRAIDDIVLGNLKEGDIAFVGITISPRLTFYFQAFDKFVSLLPNCEPNLLHNDLYKGWMRDWANDFNMFDSVINSIHHLVITAKKYNVTLYLHNTLSTMRIHDDIWVDLYLNRIFSKEQEVETIKQSWKHKIKEIRPYYLKLKPIYGLIDSAGIDAKIFNKYNIGPVHRGTPYVMNFLQKNCTDKKLTGKECTEFFYNPFGHPDEKAHQFLAKVYGDDIHARERQRTQ